MLKVIVSFAFGFVACGLWLAAHEVERRPEAVCIPLYDQTSLECWFPAPECPAPKGEMHAA